MTDDRTLLERQMADVELRPFTIDAFHRRRRRQRRNRRIATTVVGVVVAAAALAGVVAIADRDADVTTIPPAAPGPDLPRPGPVDVMSLDLQGFEPLERGTTYLIDPDGDPSTSMRVTYEIAAEGWDAWPGAVKDNLAGHTLLTITTVDNLVADGCADHTLADPPVGSTVDDLANALTQLAPFEVTEPPTDITLKGYQGKHLALTVPTGTDMAACQDGAIHSFAFANNGDEAFSGYNVGTSTDEYWILDVDGTRLVLIANTSPSSPDEHLAELQEIIDSIRIVPAIEA